MLALIQFRRVEKAVKRQESVAVATFMPFDPGKITSGSYFKTYTKPGAVWEQKNPLIIYVVDVLNCGACINEIREFIGLVKQEHPQIGQEVVIIGQNSQADLKEAMMTNFSVPVLYGYEAELAHEMRAFRKNQFPRQMLFIDRHKKIIFYRNKLAKGVITPMKYKREVIAKALKRFDSIE